jgi:chromosomal replication initiator protein
MITEKQLSKVPPMQPLPERLQKKVIKKVKLNWVEKYQAENLIKAFKELPDHKIETLYAFVGLSDGIPKTQKKVPAIDFIRYYCSIQKIPLELLQSKTREREVCKKRQILQYFLLKNSDPSRYKQQKYFKLSMASIASITGLKVHSTLVKTRKSVNNLLETDKEFKMYYNNIEQQLLQKLGLNK